MRMEERGTMQMNESDRCRKLKEAERKLTEATRGRMKAHVASEAEVFFAAFRSLSCSGLVTPPNENFNFFLKMKGMWAEPAEVQLIL